MPSEREVFVLESNGQPKRHEVAITHDEAKRLENAIEAGVRLGIPVGQERIVRYVPESEKLWLFQANESWTETQLTPTGPTQELLLKDVDGKSWTFQLYFQAPNWDVAKKLMDEMRGHRVGTYTERTAPEPKVLKERLSFAAQYLAANPTTKKRASKYTPGKPKHRWDILKLNDPRYAAWAVRSDSIVSVWEIKVCKRCKQVVRFVRERYGADRHKMVREHLAPGNDLGPSKWLRGHKVCTK